MTPALNYVHQLPRISRGDDTSVGPTATGSETSPPALLAFKHMADPTELPQMVTELVGMSKEYLKQETIEPAKKLGRYAGIGLGVGIIMAFAALFFGLAVYALFKQVLPDGEWYLVLARGLTVIVAGAAAGLLGWRMSK